MDQEKQRIAITIPPKMVPQNKENQNCDCMTREYLLKYKQGLMHWCKAPGEHISRDETVCEAEIEKKIFEIPAPAAGILDACCVPEEAEFKCSQILGYILSDET